MARPVSLGDKSVAKKSRKRKPGAARGSYSRERAGDTLTTPRVFFPHEDVEQENFIKRVDLNYRLNKDNELMHAIGNGGKRPKVEAALMVRGGVRKGYPDLGFDICRGPFHSMRIEMKRLMGYYVDKGPAAVAQAVREEQIKYGQALHKRGVLAVVAWGCEDAERQHDMYMRLGTFLDNPNPPESIFAGFDLLGWPSSRPDLVRG